jgi:hypothetical protein
MLDASIIALMMEAAGTSKTSVNFYQTFRRNNPEDSHLHTRRRENQKSQNNQRTISRNYLMDLTATLHYQLSSEFRFGFCLSVYKVTRNLSSKLNHRGIKYRVINIRNAIILLFNISSAKTVSAELSFNLLCLNSLI